MGIKKTLNINVKNNFSTNDLFLHGFLAWPWNGAQILWFWSHAIMFVTPA